MKKTLWFSVGFLLVKRGAVVHCGCDGSRDGRATKRGSSAATETGTAVGGMTISTSSSVAIQLACDAQSSAMASAWRIGVELLVLAQRFEADDGAELELSLRLWLRTGVLAARRTAIALAAAQASWCVVYAPGFALLALLLLLRTLHAAAAPPRATVGHSAAQPAVAVACWLPVRHAARTLAAGTGAQHVAAGFARRHRERGILGSVALCDRHLVRPQHAVARRHDLAAS